MTYAGKPHGCLWGEAMAVAERGGRVCGGV